MAQVNYSLRPRLGLSCLVAAGSGLLGAEVAAVLRGAGPTEGVPYPWESQITLSVEATALYGAVFGAVFGFLFVYLTLAERRGLSGLMMISLAVSALVWLSKPQFQEWQGDQRQIELWRADSKPFARLKGTGTDGTPWVFLVGGIPERLRVQIFRGQQSMFSNVLVPRHASASDLQQFEQADIGRLTYFCQIDQFLIGQWVTLKLEGRGRDRVEIRARVFKTQRGPSIEYVSASGSFPVRSHGALP